MDDHHFRYKRHYQWSRQPVGKWVAASAGTLQKQNSQFVASSILVQMKLMQVDRNMKT
jgi:hypothetical protein